ncbi:phosphate regulon sensor histidine kinase PhoR [Methylomarinum vadi]|uniref:phosphate regulon sensor histidine kinase PhoR n=1 Tax=Methylomarinum vadi TaxID=438855 RepID=UPI0004DF67F6|nr:phosphate regulon sensor histidine kinase PhoR [Methylomarinum vadi]
MGRWWWREIHIVLLLLLAATLLSVFIGHFTEICLFIAICLLLRQTWHVNELEHWLRAGAVGDNLTAKGIWEDIYFHLYKIKKTEKKRKKKLRKMIDQFRRSTNALPDAAVVLGKHAEIEWINKAARDVLGLKKSDKGQRIPNLIRSPQFSQYLKENDYTQKISIASPVNENIILQITIVPYGAGLRLLIAQDITHLKNMERMRKDFVANVSHELRTPLTVLKGYLETLQEMGDGMAAYARSFQQMSEQTERMQLLIDDLLLLTRLETREKHSECVNVPQLLSQICREGDAIENSARRIELTFGCDKNLMGDPQELRSAFTNLVINALKYSPEESVVRVHWQLLADGGACIEVEDRGEGIAANHIPRITERFYRVEGNRSRKIKGTGLGLAIVKHVLVRHDAKLEIQSELGKGSCFRCLFPRKRVC